MSVASSLVPSGCVYECHLPTEVRAPEWAKHCTPIAQCGEGMETHVSEVHREKQPCPILMHDMGRANDWSAAQR